MPATFRDFRLFSRAPEALGKCVSDIAGLLLLCNEARFRLIQKNRNQGFWGTTAAMTFNVVNNYLTAPRFISRLTDLAVCHQQQPIRNGFWEFLSWGPGTLPVNPPVTGGTICGNVNAIDRGLVPSQVDINPVGKTLRFYPTDSRDVGRRILIQGLDQNGLQFKCQDGFNWTLGQFVTLNTPFVNLTTNSGTVFSISSISGVQKDQTYGDVLMYQIDYPSLDVASEVLLSRYSGDETEPSYRRYFLDNFPDTCGNGVSSSPVQGIAKLDYYPVQIDTDWLLIDNIPALIAECQAIRFGDMETAQAMQQSTMKHREAIALLNDTLDHRVDRLNPSVGLLNTERHSQRRSGIGSVI